MTGDWQREKRKDAYWRAAKKGGYRARSAFKLKQIQTKFKLIRRGGVVVDLGAAPGGWTQVALELVGKKGVVVGVDLAYVQPVGGATFIRGDMRDEQTVRRVLERVEERIGKSGHVVDVVLSDMSPNISGNYSMDQARSFHLCTVGLAFAERVLKPGGGFACKIFEGEDFASFRAMLQERFASVRTFSPPASRKQSSEVYLLAQGYRAEQAGRFTTPATGPEATEAWWDEGHDDPDTLDETE